MNTDLTEKNLEIAQLKAELAEAVRQRNIAKVEQMRERESNEELREVPPAMSRFPGKLELSRLLMPSRYVDGKGNPSLAVLL